MNYIIIRGTANSGKSTTINAICKRLNPSRIERVQPESRSVYEVEDVDIIQNGTYILEVGGKIILVSVGAPTEQAIRITILIQICIEVKGKIDFAIVAMRTFEKSKDFDTPKELQAFGTCLIEEWIEPIPGDAFKESTTWLARIDKLTNIVKNHLNAIE